MELEDDSDEDSDEDSTVCDDVMTCDSLESGSSCGDEELLSQPKIPLAIRQKHKLEMLFNEFFIGTLHRNCLVFFVLILAFAFVIWIVVMMI